MRYLLWSLVLGLLLVTEVAAQGPGRGGNRGGGGRQRGGQDSGLQKAEVAPTFVLKSLDGESQTDLEAIRAEKPVVLYFGSYT